MAGSYIFVRRQPGPGPTHGLYSPRSRKGKLSFKRPKGKRLRAAVAKVLRSVGKHGTAGIRLPKK